MTTDRFQTSQSRLIALWLLRIFSEDCARHLLIEDGKYKDAEIAQFLGLPICPKKSDMPAVCDLMNTMREELEGRGDAAVEEPTASNLSQLAGTFCLNEAERAVVTFLALVQIEGVLKAALVVTERIMMYKPAVILAGALRLDRVQVDSAIDAGGRLVTNGIIKRGYGYSDSGHILKFYSAESARKLIRSECDHKGIMNVIGLAQTEPSDLTLADYQHLGAQLSLLVNYLRAALDRNKPGVNILLYGRPGTGKTQLTRVIARELASPVFDFSLQDDDGDLKDAEARFSSIRRASSFFRDKRALLVFDELEDILGSHKNDDQVIGKHKGAFNRMLETNPTPIFWLTNSIDELDAAFCRRFDLILETTIPPQSRRASLLRQHAGEILSEPTIRKLSELPDLAPAVITRVSAVLDEVEKAMDQNQRDETFVSVIGSTLKAQGHAMPALVSNEVLPSGVYDTGCLNTTADLEGMARMLREHPHGRICLHGPPGTGKTAFGYWLARELDRPLCVKRASDLLSPYIGGTEMRIADTFQSALAEEAVLLIDEVDSFLQDRSKAVRSWEVTQVNELLTRMESFQGVFLATTNRLEHLDQASLRRFDLKMHFDYLTRNQVCGLFRAWCHKLGIPLAGDQFDDMAESLECVTPGDFAAVARRHRFHPIGDADGFLQALKSECSLKLQANRRIGFL